MNTIIKQVVLLAVLMSLAATSFSDTLVLKSGETITGYYEGGTARVIRFRTEDGLKEYDLLSVTRIQFGDEPVSVAGEPKAPESEPVTPKPVTMEEPAVRLRTRAEGPVVPRSTSAAEGAYTVPTGSALLVRMIDSIDSEVDRVGQTFTATLADPLVVEGVEVAARGSDLRGRITEVEGAGRVRGSAELRLELTQIVVNGIPYALTTAEYREVGEGRGGETASRMGKAAGVGALIGLIAGGGKGAAIGAGVGAGAVGVVQVMTKGDQLYIPAETLLEFMIREPLVIAAK